MYNVFNKKFRHYVGPTMTHAYAAPGDTAQWNLQILPNDEYCYGFYFNVKAQVSQDGNADDAIDHMELLEILPNITITVDGVNNFRGGLVEMAQDYRLLTGHNPLLPDDIADSTGATNTDIAICIPFLYENNRMIRQMDTIVPTAFMQAGSYIEIGWTANASLGEGASNGINSAELKITPITEKLNRAVIPPTVEVGYVDSGLEMTFDLPRGNYQHIWMNKLDQDSVAALTTLDVDCDGLQLVAANTEVDKHRARAALALQYKDDEQQFVLDGDTVDKNIPPVATSATSIAHELVPIFYGHSQGKLARLPRARQSINIRLNGTAVSKRFCFRRYIDHTESGVDRKAKMMGFGPVTAQKAATNKRKLSVAEKALGGILPIKLIEPKQSATTPAAG